MRLISLVQCCSALLGTQQTLSSQSASIEGGSMNTRANVHPWAVVFLRTNECGSTVARESWLFVLVRAATTRGSEGQDSDAREGGRIDVTSTRVLKGLPHCASFSLDELGEGVSDRRQNFCTAGPGKSYAARQELVCSWYSMHGSRFPSHVRYVLSSSDGF